MAVVRVVGDDHLEWPQHAHDPGRPVVEVVAQAELELAHVDQAVRLGHPDQVAQCANGLGRHAPPAQTTQGGQARVVPTVDVTLLDELDQLALAEHRVAQEQPGELVLPRPVG